MFQKENPNLEKVQFNHLINSLKYKFINMYINNYYKLHGRYNQNIYIMIHLSCLTSEFINNKIVYNQMDSNL